ncbi:MAG: hypothetical protein Kow001_10130 [Acidobacteriota bacterium]
MWLGQGGERPGIPILEREVARLQEAVEERVVRRSDKTIPGVPRADSQVVETRGILHRLVLVVELVPATPSVTLEELGGVETVEAGLKQLRRAVDRCLKQAEVKEELDRSRRGFLQGRLPDPKLREEFEAGLAACLEPVRPPPFRFQAELEHRTAPTGWRRR